MTRRSLVLATAGALAFAVSAIWLWLAPTPAERPGTAQPRMESPLPADDLQPRPSVQREGVATSQVEVPARVKSIGDVLDEIGVSMTPELAEELAADGVKLDQPVEGPRDALHVGWVPGRGTAGPFPAIRAAAGAAMRGRIRSKDEA